MLSTNQKSYSKRKEKLLLKELSETFRSECEFIKKQSHMITFEFQVRMRIHKETKSHDYF